jgi:hypothetical protein
MASESALHPLRVSTLKLLHCCYNNKVYSQIPCVAILNKQKCLFSKTDDKEVKQVLSGGWYQREREDIRKGGEGKCGGNTIYSCTKMEK